MRALFLTLSMLLAGCSSAPVIDDGMKRVREGALPADFSGSWQRNYARDDDVGSVLRRAYYELARTSPDQRHMSEPGLYGPTPQDAESMLALARLAELITRPDVLTVSQDANQISVARDDDFSLTCAFYAGVARSIDTPVGTEICGFDGNDLVSHMILRDGLEITNRFTISDDAQQLRVVTTVSSSTSRKPFSLRRFYTRFEQPRSGFHCIETLSMKRVCSTRPIEQ